MMKINTLLIMATVILTGCAHTSNPADMAKSTLVDYFDQLNNGKYQQATELYGGSYETLLQMNPDVEPSDYSVLWKNACTINGFQCIKIKSVDFIETDKTIYSFQVQFLNPDGSLFIQGPCCGADQSPETKITSFIYNVQVDKTGVLRVMDLPVYIP